MFPDLNVFSSSCVNAPENKILSNRGGDSSPEEPEPPVERLVCIWLPFMLPELLITEFLDVNITPSFSMVPSLSIIQLLLIVPPAEFSSTPPERFSKIPSLLMMPPLMRMPCALMMIKPLSLLIVPPEFSIIAPALFSIIPASLFRVPKFKMVPSLLMVPKFSNVPVIMRDAPELIWRISPGLITRFVIVVSESISVVTASASSVEKAANTLKKAKTRRNFLIKITFLLLENN